MTDPDLDRLFKALADPTRRAILQALAEVPDQSLFQLCAGAYATTGAAMSRQAVTQHLDLLEAAGLVTITWAGRVRLHRLVPGVLETMRAEWLDPLLRGRSGPATKE